ncbi:MAG TPA: T9SS type A sorting domain-containing protein [Bacteroidia bacterium]|jgi:hypothetical protein|nr:T9SS type A sorting domain-containing protein [Bacteroidia bacterium]
MKKICTLVISLLSSAIAFGQSIHILDDKKDVTNSSVTITVTKGEEVITHLSLLNTTANKLDYQVNRTILTAPIGECSNLYFCTASQCFLPDTSTTWTPPSYLGSSIDPHETLPNKMKDTNSVGLEAHYNVCPDVCTNLKVLYRVFLTKAGTTDTAYITITYSCSTGIAKEYSFLGSLSDAYPNPAKSNFSLQYALPVFRKSEIIIHDVLGKKVMELSVEKQEGIMVIPTTALQPGVYFYTLLVNGQRAVTKRVVISE